jgi:hypothetical protein
LLALVVLSLCVGALAQGGTGELSGLVTDPTGAIVAGATVTLTNPATKEIRTTTTTAAGIYTFPALAVGSYSLELSPKGFKSVRVQDIVGERGRGDDSRRETGSRRARRTGDGGGRRANRANHGVVNFGSGGPAGMGTNRMPMAVPIVEPRSIAGKLKTAGEDILEGDDALAKERIADGSLLTVSGYGYGGYFHHWLRSAERGGGQQTESRNLLE